MSESAELSIVSCIGQVRLMASYNAWMNGKLYAACATLTPQQLAENRGAFFGSVLGTLNHLLVADTVWLKRFAAAGVGPQSLAPMLAIAQPAALDVVLFDEWPALVAQREWLDAVIAALAAELDDHALQQVITYSNFKGVVARRPLSGLLMHLFNHQTHHRGQITTLLSQAGVDVGVTDLLALIPEI